MTAPRSDRWPLPAPYQFEPTTRLLRTGGRDPSVRREEGGLWRTTWTAEGAATVHVRVEDGELRAEAWGDGAARALADVPHWVGLVEPAWELPSHPVTDRLLRDHPGVRLNDTRDPFAAMTTTVLQQLVTWNEAAANWRKLCEVYGEEAPGPWAERGEPAMRMAPRPEAIRRAGVARLQGLGIVGGGRPQALVQVARVADALPRAFADPTDVAIARLTSIPGVGAWTANYVLGMRAGRPEAVPVGDYALPHLVSWGLAGEARGSDERMLELLAPFPGQAFRVIRLLFAARIEMPRRGPKRPWRRVR